jgi:hypothetical protein
MMQISGKSFLRKDAIMYLLSAIALSLKFSLISALPVVAEQQVDTRYLIEEILGNAQGFDRSFRRLQNAVRFDDPVTLANLGEYPLTVSTNGEVFEVPSADHLISKYDTLMPETTRQEIAAQNYDDLIVSSEGVGFANGAIWMNAICDTEDCSVSHWSIVGINN